MIRNRALLHLVAGGVVILTAGTAATVLGAQEGLPAGPARETFRRICSSCHEAEIVLGNKRTHNDWQTLVGLMMDLGAQGTDEEMGQIVEYLTANFGVAPAVQPASADSGSPNGQSDLGLRPGPLPDRKHVLAWADIRNGPPDETTRHALTTIERLGHDSGLYDTVIRSDSGPEASSDTRVANLKAFDAIFFYGSVGVDLSPAQKADLLSFIKDDGKGFVAAPTAAAAFPSWPEFGDMLGGRFDDSPWNVIDAPIVVEDRAFPATRHFPSTFNLRDEMFQIQDFSRDKIHVLLRLDADKLDLTLPGVHRKDRDFPLVWARTYGKGRVFYSALGRESVSWDNPDLQKMYLEAIKWAMGLAEGDVTPRKETR